MAAMQHVAASFGASQMEPHQAALDQQQHQQSFHLHQQQVSHQHQQLVVSSQHQGYSCSQPTNHQAMLGAGGGQLEQHARFQQYSQLAPNVAGQRPNNYAHQAAAAAAIRRPPVPANYCEPPAPESGQQIPLGHQTQQRPPSSSQQQQRQSIAAGGEYYQSAPGEPQHYQSAQQHQQVRQQPQSRQFQLAADGCQRRPHQPQGQQYYAAQPELQQCYEAPELAAKQAPMEPAMVASSPRQQQRARVQRAPPYLVQHQQQQHQQLARPAQRGLSSSSPNQQQQQHQAYKRVSEQQLMMNQQQPHLVPPHLAPQQAAPNGYPNELAGGARYASQQHAYLEHQEQSQYNNGSSPTLLQQQLSDTGASNSPAALAGANCRPQARLAPAGNQQRPVGLQHQLETGGQLPPAKRAPLKLGPAATAMAGGKRDQLNSNSYPTPPQQQLIGSERVGVVAGGQTGATALEQAYHHQQQQVPIGQLQQQQGLPSVNSAQTNNTQLLASQAAAASRWSQQQHHAALTNDSLQQSTSTGYNNGSSSLMQACGISKPPPLQAYQHANYSQQDVPPPQQQSLLVGGHQLNDDHHIHNQHHQHHHQHLQQNTIIERTMPKNHVNAIQQQQQYIATNNNNTNSNIVMNQHQHHYQAPATSRTTNIPLEPVSVQPISSSSSSPQTLATPIPQHTKPVCGDQLSNIGEPASGQTDRLSLPLHNVPLLLGPFKLDHAAQYTTKVFHINPQLFDSLSRSMKNPQSNVIQELQFRAYLGQINTATGAIDPNFNSHHHQCISSQAADAARPNNNGLRNWPELFQVSINQNLVRLDRSKGSSGGSIAASIFQYCRLGDNYLEIQANDCYCTHEFVMGAVDRPTIKAFMSSCFKSCVLETEKCIQKLKFNFGSPGFINQSFQQHQLANIINEYITEQIGGGGGGTKQTRIRISLRCPISGKRMRTPTRGQDCKHLQCFDLENFLHLNLERSKWNCPICSNAIPFNMLELDQHQLNIVQSMSDVPNTDEILMDPVGQWRAYYSPPTINMAGSPPHLNLPIQHPPPAHPHHNQQHQVHHQIQQQQCPPIVPQPPATMGAGAITARSTGTYHPQAPIGMNVGGNNRNGPIVKQQPQPQRPVVMRPMSCSSPAPWESIQNQQPAQAIEQPIVAAAGNNRRPSTRAPPRVASGSPLATTGTSQRYQDHHQVAAVSGSSSSSSSSSFLSARNSPTVANLVDQGKLDNLSPLAAMERTIIQHEQQMGPPPFDPNSFAATATSISSTTPPSQQQQQPRGSPLATTNATNCGNLGANSASNPMISQPNVPPQSAPQQQQHQQSSPATSCRTESRMSSSAGCYSPVPRKVSSPQSSRLVSASPQLPQQQPPTPLMAQRGPSTEPLPQSPGQQQQIHQQHQVQPASAISTPSTPLSCMIFHGSIEGGPATPYQGQYGGPNSVPANHQQQQYSTGQPASVGSTTVVATTTISTTSVNGQQQPGCVDHQPLSNGSASIGSITSASTLTPSGQSLGSNGMGGDSRCATAPHGQQGSQQNLGSSGSSSALRLDDMLMSSSAGQHQQHHSQHQVGPATAGTMQQTHLQSSSAANHFSSASSSSVVGAQFAKQQTSGYVEASSSLMQQHSDVKNEILVSKLMAESSESLLKDPRNSEVAMALEEAEWKQMFDSQGRNEVDNGQFSPSLHANESSLQNSNNKQQQQSSIGGQQGQQQNQRGSSKPTKKKEPEASQRSEHELSPSQNEFANYLDAGDGGVCLPPDYSIFDLFER